MSELVSIARKVSTDPEQEKLRQSKDEWNKEVSLLIQELIAFKRGLNGRGDKVMGIPPSSIKDPLPPQMDSIVGLIDNQVAKVLQQAREIKQHQEYYSLHRTKSVKQASWWGSQFKAYFTLLKRISRVERRARLDLIKSCAEFKSSLKDFEAQILSYQDPKSIPESVTFLTRHLNSFLGAVNPILAQMADLGQASVIEEATKEKSAPLPKNPKAEVYPKDDPIPEVSPEAPAEEPLPAAPAEVPKGQSDYEYFLELKDGMVSLGFVVNFLNKSTKVTSETKAVLKKEYNLFSKEVAYYDNLMAQPGGPPEAIDHAKMFQSLSNRFETIKQILTNIFVSAFPAGDKILENPVDIMNMRDIKNVSLKLPIKLTQRFDEIKKVAVEQSEIQKEADNAIKRWINKSLLSWNPSNLDKIKLDVIQLSGQVRGDINKLMDKLEDREQDLTSILETFTMVKSKLASLIEKVQILAADFEISNRRLDKSKDFAQYNINERDLSRLKEMIALLNGPKKVRK